MKQKCPNTYAVLYNSVGKKTPDEVIGFFMIRPWMVEYHQII